MGYPEIRVSMFGRNAFKLQRKRYWIKGKKNIIEEKKTKNMHNFKEIQIKNIPSSYLPKILVAGISKEY